MRVMRSKMLKICAIPTELLRNRGQWCVPLGDFSTDVPDKSAKAKMRFFTDALDMRLNTIYLRSLSDCRDVCFDAYRPVQMKFVLVELEQEHDEHEQGVDHEKRENRFVPELYQVRSDPSSFVFVVVDWVQILVDQIPPELLFGHRQERHRALPQ